MACSAIPAMLRLLTEYAARGFQAGRRPGGHEAITEQFVRFNTAAASQSCSAPSGMGVSLLLLQA
jgi:hypothetical protein